ncbi:MAG: DNA-directed RNA polymerase subunit omega [Deltaproteobacteria bacterium]|nr:MAG: DNA-directed RNA polymerase subunit omega [Deltaproteobacteria bacterium]
MARITVEDCLRKVNNRFAVIHLAAKRVRQLRKGAEPLVVSKNRDIVVALREIAAGKVYPLSEEEIAALEAAVIEEPAPELPPADEQAESPEPASDEEPSESESEEAAPEGN